MSKNEAKTENGELSISMSYKLVHFLMFVWRNLQGNKELSDVERVLMFIPLAVTSSIIEKFEPDAETIRRTNKMLEDFEKIHADFEKEILK